MYATVSEKLWQQLEKWPVLPKAVSFNALTRTDPFGTAVWNLVSKNYSQWAIYLTIKTACLGQSAVVVVSTMVLILH